MNTTSDSYLEELADGFVFDDYYIERLVARAGFSNVYRATDRTSGRQVAIKVLKHQLATDKGVVRFKREFDALQSLKHNHIVEMIAYGQLPDGRPYIAMEWLEGKTLGTHLRGGPLTVDEALPIIEQLCQALTAAHQKGVIHRDLKGSNIMLLPDGKAQKVKLVNFGIAKPMASEAAGESHLTTTGQALGTPHTMAPEQITGRPLDARCDIYALGVILFEMLTGRMPFDAPSSIEIADMHLRTKPPHASDLAPVSESVDAVIQRCLSKKPDDRYDSATDVAKALRIAAQKRPLQIVATDGAQDVFALGLYFQAHLQGDEDDVPEHVFDDIEDLLATAHERCTQAGLQMAMSSGQAFLAVLPLAQNAANQDSRQKVIDLALDLTELFAKNDNNAPLSIQVALHGAPVKTVSGAGTMQFVGGELLAIGNWTGQKITAPLYATKTVLSGLETRFRAEPVTGRGNHMRILGRA